MSHTAHLDPNELYETPVNSFVAGFIGENNTFTGTVKELASGSAKVETSTGEIIIANPIAVSSAGEKSRISLRPERVNINPTEQIENRFEAEKYSNESKKNPITSHHSHSQQPVDCLNYEQ